MDGLEALSGLFALGFLILIPIILIAIAVAVVFSKILQESRKTRLGSNYTFL